MLAADVEQGVWKKDLSSRFFRFWTVILRVCRSAGSSQASAASAEKVTTEKVSEGADAKRNYTDAESAEATAPLWSIYVSEADRYDKALVESWKGDMSGMLIFSGLYSASLTAFLIESYKTLQPDSGDATVALLTEMVSLQLAVASGITLGDLAPAASFQPTAASLVCNILWFLSLALSLTCALLATLVEQWARDFIHKTEMCPSSVQRARVFSFLYFGLKKFKMHVVVDTIPMILHASLFFFLLD